MEGELFLVVDTTYNRYWYPKLIGRCFPDPPGYAQVERYRKVDPKTGRIDLPRHVFDFDEYICASCGRERDDPIHMHVATQRRN